VYLLFKNLPEIDGVLANISSFAFAGILALLVGCVSSDVIRKKIIFVSKFGQRKNNFK
jgi:hypothetical protein